MSIRQCRARAILPATSGVAVRGRSTLAGCLVHRRRDQWVTGPQQARPPQRPPDDVVICLIKPSVFQKGWLLTRMSVYPSSPSQRATSSRYWRQEEYEP